MTRKVKVRDVILVHIVFIGIVEAFHVWAGLKEWPKLCPLPLLNWYNGLFVAVFVCECPLLSFTPFVV